MGTRADFYIGVGESAEWIGSVAWDGYEWEEQPECALMTATTQDEFVAAVGVISQDRKDWTSPKQGWPWPWKNSRTTDRAYAFADGKTQAFHWGLLPSENEGEDGAEVCDWPDMSDKKNVTLGPRSGLIVLRG